MIVDVVMEVCYGPDFRMSAGPPEAHLYENVTHMIDGLPSKIRLG